MTIIAAVLLTGYLIAVLYALLAPTRQHDPQMGMAIGCLTMVALFIVALGALLTIGAVYDARWLVRIVFFIAVFPGISLIGGGIFHLAKLRRERRDQKRFEQQAPSENRGEHQA